MSLPKVESQIRLEFSLKPHNCVDIFLFEFLKNKAVCVTLLSSLTKFGQVIRLKSCMNLFSNLKGLFTNNLAKRLRPETFVMEKFLMEDVSKHVLKMKKSRFILKIAKYPDHLDLHVSKKLYLGNL